MAKAPQKSRILLVDDHPLFLEGLRQMIDRSSALEVCAEVADGPAAMKAIADLEPDLVIVDITLAHTSGLDLIKTLKAKYEDLPVLVISMHDESLYAERAIRAGAQGYVMKSEPAKTVRSAIMKVLGGDIFLSEKMSGSVLSKLMSGKTDVIPMSPVEQLSDRELEVFQLMGQGMPTRQIAEELHLT